MKKALLLLVAIFLSTTFLCADTINHKKPRTSVNMEQKNIIGINILECVSLDADEVYFGSTTIDNLIVTYGVVAGTITVDDITGLND